MILTWLEFVGISCGLFCIGDYRKMCRIFKGLFLDMDVSLLRRVAQLVRALARHARGRRFESARAYHKKTAPANT